MRYFLYIKWLMFPKLRYSISLDDFNPFDPLGLLDPLIEHGSAKNLQNDAQSHDATMFLEQKKHDIDMFNRGSEFISTSARDQYQRQRDLLQDSPTLQMKGLKSAGLNPILAATGGFKSPAGSALPVPSSRSSATAKGSSGSASRASSNNFSMAARANAKYLYEQANLTSAQKNKVEAETRKIESEQPKRDFYQFFWEVYNGTLRRFDEAFQKWSDNNKKMLDEWMDKYGLSWQSIKDDFKQYVTDAPPGKNPVSGGQGRYNRRNKK